jgi:glycosyltransferase involved in cell wall biosynthesis
MTPLLIYRDRLLPISETFIQAQASALKRFRPQFAGLRRVAPSLPFNEDPIVVTTRCAPASHVLAAAYAATGVAPAFTRRAQAVGAKLIHAHFAPDGAHAVRLAERLGLPLIVTLHGYDVTVRCEFANKYAKLWERASLFICVSEFIKRKALEAGFPDAKLRVHHIGIDCSKFLPGNGKRDENRILFIGRLIEKKGLPFLLNAMRDVQNKRPRTVLQVIGDGPDRKDLEAMAAQKRINCEFVGSKSAEAVRASLGGCAVLCAPSLTAQNGDSEGLPTVVLEAQAMGIPVVSTYHAGIPEAVLPEETGLLVPEHDVAKMSEALLRYLCDWEFARTSGARGAEWVRDRFDLTRQTPALESIYDQVAC